jgi:hypothetical protein
MQTEGSRRTLHNQVAGSDKGTTFRDDSESARALPFPLIQRMGKSLADVFALRGNLSGMGLGLSGRSNRSDISDTASTASTGSYPNSPLPAFTGGGSARVGYTSFSNPAASPSATGTTTTSANSSPVPPPRPPRKTLCAPGSPVPPSAGSIEDTISGNTTAAPPRRGIQKSASAFVTSGTTFDDLVSPASAGAEANGSRSTAPFKLDKSNTISAVPGGGHDSRLSPTTEEGEDVTADSTGGDTSPVPSSPTPPAKPPKPVRMARRTNVCITVDPLALDAESEELQREEQS